MQTEFLTNIEKNGPPASVSPFANQSRQTFDLPELCTSFCTWYQGCLADRRQLLHTSISPAIPRYVQGNRLFMKHLLFTVGKCSLLYAGEGEISVQVDALQHTSRRHSLAFTVDLTGAPVSSAGRKALFQPGPAGEHQDLYRFRSENLHYAQIIAESFGGDIRVDDSAGSGLHFLVGIKLFTR